MGIPRRLAAVARRRPRVRELAHTHRVGLLSNVDDALLARTRLASLPFAPGLVITSQRVRQYKPNPGLYHAARRIAGPSLGSPG